MIHNRQRQMYVKRNVHGLSEAEAVGAMKCYVMPLLIIRIVLPIIKGRGS